MGKSQVQVAAHVVSHSQWSGPLPPPESLSTYEKLVPGAAERLLALAEREAAARIEQTRLDHAADQEAQKQALKDYHVRVSRGQIYGAIVAISFMVGAVCCARYGQTAIGVALVGATIVGLVNALVSPKRR